MGSSPDQVQWTVFVFRGFLFFVLSCLRFVVFRVFALSRFRVLVLSRFRGHRICATPLLLDGELTPHEAMARAADLRAFEGEPPGRVGVKYHRRLTAAALRDDHVRAGPENPEPMVRVVAPQPELDHGSALDLDSGRAEREAFSRQLNHLSILRGPGRR